MSKGSTYRPNNQKKYDENFDRIFKKKDDLKNDKDDSLKKDDKCN